MFTLAYLSLIFCTDHFILTLTFLQCCVWVPLGICYSIFRSEPEFRCGLTLYRDVLLLFPGQEDSALIHRLIFTTHECTHTLHHLFSTITKSSIAINSTRDWIPLKEAWDWSWCMWGEQRGLGWRKRKFIKVSTFRWGWNHFRLLGRWLCVVQFSRLYCFKEIVLLSVGGMK